MIFEMKVRVIPELMKLADRNVRLISAGDKHVICRTDSGAMFSWGYGANGRLGHGDAEDRVNPKLMDTLR
jgi:alpha-tubulin suppressor-like RCC1 family protein